jgi:hypothetical protein
VKGKRSVTKKKVSWYIFVIRQTVECRTPAFTLPFSWRLHITITYNLSRLRLWYVDVVTVIAYTPEVVYLTFQTSRHEKDWAWSELTWFETSVLYTVMISKHTSFSLSILVFLNLVKEGLSRSFHYTLLLVPVIYIQYAFGNAGCVKYGTGTRLLLMRLVFETDRYWPDNVQYSLIKIGDRKEFPVIVNFRFLPQCSFSFTELLKFYFHSLKNFNMKIE